VGHVKKEIQVLVLEDVAADVVLINHEFRKAGLPFRAKRVETRADFLHQLEHHPPDLILSDHGLPSFDGFTALAIARDKCPDVPFIFVTSALGEEFTIATFESGATDYVLKNRLSKLVPAVQRALREAEERRKRRQAEAALRESEERFRMLVEGVKDYAIFMLDCDGRITSWNAGAQWMKGYRSEEILGQHFRHFYTPEDAQQLRPEQALRTAAAEGRFEEEGWRVRKGGSKFLAHAVITSLRDEKGQLRGFAQVTRNITEWKQAEAAMRQSEERFRALNEELSERVRERTAELEAANEELEAFNYSVSHDLRTPLRHIDGFVKSLQKSAADQLDRKSRRHLETIAESAAQMSNLIDHLLAFSRLGRAELRKTTVSLDELVRAARRDLQRDAERRKVEWVISPLPEVLGDPVLLRLVLVNLLSNALKYTRGRPVARIEIAAQETPTERILFIRDNGVGFDMKYADKLFGVFQRLHSNADFEGTGIGLASVRRIIQRHGGRTWAEGSVDGGATFYLSLPKDKEVDNGKEQANPGSG
jgi:PAS domain S-box-containing protein